MRPPIGLWAFMILKASCVQMKLPVRQVSTTLFQSSSGTSSNVEPPAPKPLQRSSFLLRLWASRQASG